jgi:hypothetical protein
MLHTFQKKAATVNRKMLKPIISTAVLERVQIDLIDYSNKPEKNFKYILHIKDHFSKYNALYAYQDKTAAVTRDRQTLTVCKLRPPMEIPCVSERQSPL